jgi:hypothetical protein
MKKFILLFAFMAFVFASCESDQTDENNAVELQQLKEQNATGKDCGSSPGNKDCDQ